MLKAVAIGVLMMLAQGLRVADHEAYVYNADGSLAYETNMVKKDNTYAGPGAVAIGKCAGKKEGDDCGGIAVSGKCLVCDGLIQCRYWGRC